MVGRQPAAEFGSIPACAGEPSWAFSGARNRRVYPRVCGGTLPSALIRSSGAGLSPRVRGNHRAGVGHDKGFGSIPACAGEPGLNTFGNTADGVYPRVCGGTRHPASELGLRWGLSPRVRGNRLPCRHATAAGRSIPACAGEPRGASLSGQMMKVYPRVCGGTPRADGGMRGQRGLSPRVRGNRGHGQGRAGRGGSIPACAGEPVNG